MALQASSSSTWVRNRGSEPGSGPATVFGDPVRTYALWCLLFMIRESRRRCGWARRALGLPSRDPGGLGRGSHRARGTATRGYSVCSCHVWGPSQAAAKRISLWGSRVNLLLGHRLPTSTSELVSRETCLCGAASSTPARVHAEPPSLAFGLFEAFGPPGSLYRWRCQCRKGLFGDFNTSPLV